MINSNMRLYNYFTFGKEDKYGQPQISQYPEGQIKMAIYLTSQSIQQNILYKNSQYLGLTQAPVDDSYIIENGNTKLKVLYVNPSGRFKQVFMVEL